MATLAVLLASVSAGNGADDIKEVEVDWKIGDMIAHPTANFYYVINETDSDLVKIDSGGNFVTAHHRFDYSLEDARLFISIDGSDIYLSLPHSRRLIRLDAVTLAEEASVEMEEGIKSFVVASDGRVYGVFSGDHRTHFSQFDADTGAKLGTLYPQSFYSNGSSAPLVRLNIDGDSVFVMETGLSGGLGSVSQFDVVANSFPTLTATHFPNHSGDTDFVIDDANNRIYRSANIGYLVQAWDMATASVVPWPNTTPRWGISIAQFRGSTSIWTYEDFLTSSNALVEFDKATGNVIRTIPFDFSDPELAYGYPLRRALEQTPNGKLMYGRYRWQNTNGQPAEYRYLLGFVDSPPPNLVYQPLTHHPFAPTRVYATDETHTDQVDITWDASTRATGYRVYRSEIDDPSTATQIGSTQGDTFFTDHTAVIAADYFYWIRAENAAGLSLFSLSDEGAVFSPPDAPKNLTASDGTHVSQVYVSCTFDPKSTEFHVYRSVTNDFSTATEVGSVVNHLFTDVPPTKGQIYYYWGRFENSVGLSEVSEVTTGYSGDLVPPQSAPTIFNASDGSNPLNVNVTWNLVSDARSFDVLRSNSNDPGTATLIGNTTNHYFNDEETVAEVVYYYWARAVNTAGHGPLTTVDSGFRATPTPPATPANLTATDAQFHDMVRLQWSSPQYATGYKVFRHTSDDFAGASEIATIARIASFFEDTTMVPGTTYFYWIQAYNDDGNSGVSNSDQGSAFIPPAPQNPPTSVIASYGRYDLRVRVDWDAVTYADRYEIFRSSTNDSATAISIGFSSTLLFNDYDVVSYERHYYWVKAVNDSGESDLSSSNLGFALIGRPGNLYATYDLFDDRVRLTWNSVADAVLYRVYRNTELSDITAEEIGVVNPPALRLDDETALEGVTYYYFVKAEASGGELGTSGQYDIGRKASESTSGIDFHPIKDPRDIDFDPSRGLAYITTEKGFVEVLDIHQRTILSSGWNTDGGLEAADISPDGNKLLLAQTRLSFPIESGRTDVIDLNTGIRQSFEFPLYTDDERGIYDVAFLDGGVALTTSGGNGEIPLRKWNLNTGTFVELDVPATPSGKIAREGLLNRTPDRSLVAIQASNTGLGRFLNYTPSTDQFGSSVDAGYRHLSGGISTDGTVLALVADTAISLRSTADGSELHSIPGLFQSATFDPVREILYALDYDSDSLRAFRTSDWSEALELSLERPIGRGLRKYQKGYISISPVGDRLAVTFDEGVLILRPDLYIEPPSHPDLVTASDAEGSDGVVVTWSPSMSANHYQLFRSEVNDPETANLIAIGLTETGYLDTNADAGIVYYYWVQAFNFEGASPISVSDSGERQVAPPSDVTASYGTSVDGIDLSWAAPLSATSYAVFRSINNDPADAIEIASGVTATFFTDTDASFGSVAYYWVVAANASGSSEFSTVANGLRQLRAPADLLLNLEHHANVTLTWQASEGADFYSVFRGTTDVASAATWVGNTSILSFVDEGAGLDQLHHWFVRPHFLADGEFSAAVSGRRIYAAPFDLQASTTLRDRISLSWSAPPGSGTTFEVHRSTSNDPLTASTVASTINLQYDDQEFPPGIPVYYWVSSKSATAPSEWSSSFQGYRRIDNFGEYTADHGLTGSDAEPTANPDDDRFTNFEEWAQGGTDPTDASSRPPLVSRIQTVASADYFTISYLRFYGGSENGSDYEHEWATYTTHGTLDLESGLWPEIPLPTVAPADLEAAPSGYQWGCVRLPLTTDDSALGFMHLMVTPPAAP